MNIACVNIGHPAHALREHGHTVLDLPLQSGIHMVGAILQQQDFVPDLFIQMEHLGKRVLCADLPSLPCVKIFWSIDTHLNLFWQQYYARLFDVFATPHPGFVRFLPQESRPSSVLHLPWWGSKMDWIPHADRSNVISFVGRQNTERPLRANLGLLLSASFGVTMQENLSYADMLTLYANTRLLPNESIAFETNFRLLEGASAGCCVLTPNIGVDQDAQLIPGTECLVYNDGLELLDLLHFCQKHPLYAERIGKAARQRIQTDHLVAHRALALEQHAASGRVGVKGEQAQQAFWMTMAQLARHGRDEALCKKALVQLGFIKPTPETISMMLRLAWEAGAKDMLPALLEKAGSFFSRQNLAEHAALSLKATVFGISALQGNVEFMKRFRVAGSVSESPGDMCLDWAAQYARASREWESGFHFLPGIHVPSSSLDMIGLARKLGAKPELCAELTSSLGAVQKHIAELNMESLRILAATRTPDWERLVSYALSCLRCFSIQEGLKAFRDAGDSALLHGQQEAFLRFVEKRKATHVLHAI